MAFEQVHRFGHRRSRFSTPSRRKRMRVWAVVGFFMAFVALAWAWAFQRGPGEAGSGLPLLVADQPTRERPNDPGGLKVADIDPLQYDSGRSPPKVESILPAPEKPLPQPIPEQRAAATPAAPSDTSAPTANAAPPPSAEVADANPAGPPVKLVPDVETPPAKPAPAAAAVPVPKPQPKPAPAAKPKEETKPMAVSPGGYRLQLASLKSAGDAREVEAKLKRNYGDVLGAAGFSIVSVNLGDRGTYYRVMAGPMSQGSAAQMCDALKQRGAACILAKP